VVLQLHWINEFNVTNLLKANAFMLSVTLKLSLNCIHRSVTRRREPGEKFGAQRQ